MAIITSSVAFIHFIQELRTTAKNPAAKHIPPDEEMRALRTFFFNTSRSELEQTEELFGGDKKTSASSLLWMTTGS